MWLKFADRLRGKASRKQLRKRENGLENEKTAQKTRKHLRKRENGLENEKTTQKTRKQLRKRENSLENKKTAQKTTIDVFLRLKKSEKFTTKVIELTNKNMIADAELKTIRSVLKRVFDV